MSPFCRGCGGRAAFVVCDDNRAAAAHTNTRTHSNALSVTLYVKPTHKHKRHSAVTVICKGRPRACAPTIKRAHTDKTVVLCVCVIKCITAANGRYVLVYYIFLVYVVLLVGSAVRNKDNSQNYIWLYNIIEYILYNIFTLNLKLSDYILLSLTNTHTQTQTHSFTATTSPPRCSHGITSPHLFC